MTAVEVSWRNVFGPVAGGPISPHVDVVPADPPLPKPYTALLPQPACDIQQCGDLSQARDTYPSSLITHMILEPGMSS